MYSHSGVLGTDLRVVKMSEEPVWLLEFNLNNVILMSSLSPRASANSTGYKAPKTPTTW